MGSSPRCLQLHALYYNCSPGCRRGNPAACRESSLLRKIRLRLGCDVHGLCPCSCVCHDEAGFLWLMREQAVIVLPVQYNIYGKRSTVNDISSKMHLLQVYLRGNMSHDFFLFGCLLTLYTCICKQGYFINSLNSQGVKVTFVERSFFRLCIMQCNGAKSWI